MHLANDFAFTLHIFLISKWFLRIKPMTLVWLMSYSTSKSTSRIPKRFCQPNLSFSLRFYAHGSLVKHL